ncbi:MAG: hypothetical protein CL610_14945 [Anaerolineaceae bacterium]|nr:hypothetical protein [Anaerolineaceae bacterium]
MMTPQNKKNPFHRQVARRIAPVIFAIFVVIGLVGMFNARAIARNELRAEHRLTLLDLEQKVAAELDQAADHLRLLTSETIIDALSTSSVSQSSDGGIRNRVISQFLRWMETNDNRFSRLRYISNDGQVLLEIDNTVRGTSMISTDLETTVPETLYTRALGAEIGEVFLISPYTYQQQTNQTVAPRFLLSTPIYAAEEANSAFGVVQVDIDAATLLDSITRVSTDELADIEGRRLIVLNNANATLADTEAADVNAFFINMTGAGREFAPTNTSPDVRQLAQFLNTNPGTLELASMDDMLISAREVNFLEAADMPWRLVIIDQAGSIFAGNNIQSLLILVASLVIGAGIAMGLVLVVQKALLPFEQASTLAQQLAQSGSASAGPAQPEAGDSLTQAIVQMSNQVKVMAQQMESQQQRVKGNLEIAARISREAALQADLDVLMNRVIHMICSEYQLHHAQVFMMDDIGQNAILTYSHGEQGQKLLQRELRLPVHGQSLISQVFGTRASVIDVVPSANAPDSGCLPETQSRLALPLLAGEAVIGVLDIQSIEPDTFRDEARQSFELLADQIGVAIYNIRLLQQSQERVDQINSLNREMTRTAWEGAEENLQFIHAWHYDLREIEPAADVPPTGDALSVPITIRGHVIGSLDVATPEGSHLTYDEQLILQAVTDRVALAIDRARLFQETQLSLSETSLMYDLSRHINEATALEEIIQAIILSVMPGALGGQIMQFDDYPADGQPEWLSITADWYQPEHQREQDTLVGLRLYLPDHRFGSGLHSDAITLISNIENEPNLDDFLRGTLLSIGAQALVTIPVNMRGLWRGAITIEFPEPRRFSPQDQRIFTALIDQASVAIDNSLLLRQTAAALEETRRLYAASRSISSAPDLNLVYTAAAEHLAEASYAINQISILLAGPTPSEDAPWLELTYAWRDGTAIPDLVGQRFDRDSTPQLPGSDEQMQLVRDVTQDLTDHPELMEMIRSQGIGSLIITPLRSRQKWFGMLVCASDQPNGFDEAYGQFVQTVADQIAISVENHDLIEAAETERASLSSILESMPSGVLVLDPKTRLPLNANRQIERLLGKPVSTTEPFTAQYYNLYRTGTQLHYADNELPIVQAAQHGDLVFADDIVAIHEDGSQVDLLLNAAPIHEPDGSISMIVAAFENISSLRGLENALQDNLRETIALYEATRALAESDEVEDVLEVILMQIAMMEPFEAAVVLYDEVSGSHSVARTLVNSPETFTLPTEIYHNSRALWVSDVNGKSPFSEATRDQLLERGIHAISTVPLRTRTREEALAWLVVAYATPHRFSSEDDRYLTTLADSAATTLDNRYLFQRTQSALQEASVLYQASRALVEVTTHDDILETVKHHLVHEAVNQAFIVLLTGPSWDDPAALATVAASWSRDDEGINLLGVTLNQDQFPAWRLLTSPDLLLIDNVQFDEDLNDMERMGLEALGAQSVAVIPLRTAARPIGVIWIGTDVPYPYTEREIRIYQSFGEQTSITMEAARLYEQAERRAAQLQTSAQVSQFASSILDLDILLPRLVDLIRTAFQYDHVQIFLMDREDRYATLRASTGDAGKQLLAIKHRLEKGSTSVIGAVTAENRPIIAADTGQADVVHRPNPYLPHTRSEMALPLVIKGKVVGALDVQSNQPNSFTEEDVAVLTTLAAQISVAIDNARLFEQAEHRASDMSLLFAVTTAAASAESLSEALQNVANDLRDSLGALSIGIYLPVEYVDEITEESFVTVRAAAVAGYDRPLSSISEIHLGDNTNAIGLAADNGRSRIINKIEDEPLYTPLAAGAQSAVVVPLASGSQIVGVITMENADAFAYNHETLTLLQTMGGTLTALIQNQQLLEQLQETNEQLLEIDRVKSEFLANMSHELRTPLNSIIGFSRVILKGIDGPLTEMQEQDLSTIYNSGQHLLNLINDILDQAKIAAGKMEIKPDYFDMKSVIDGVRSIGIGLVKDKPIDIKIDIESGLPQVYSDEFRTRQVLLNLLSNAAKFTQQGSITISAYRSRHDTTGQPVVRVDVTDTGIGIAEKDIPLLFEAFRQVDSSLTRTAGGTGLGLPISKSLIEMQGGEMFVHSQVNVGSTFSITAPLDPPSGQRPDTDDEEPEVLVSETADHDTMKLLNGSNGAKTPEPDRKSTAIFPAVMAPKRQVLIIEDNPDRVDQYRRIIQREGFDVFSASIPLEAEAMASGLRPSVIIMDVNFASGVGWDILQKLKERDDTFDIPIIVVTLSDEEQRALDAGAFSFLQHPIMPDDLVRELVDAERESSTERILIIDDQPESTRLLEQLLDEHGHYRVFSAHNGSEGVSMVARRRPDLVILDLRMPEMDGFDVLNELRSNPETAYIPVLVVTGDDALNSEEQDQLDGVAVMYKTNISLEDCKQFLHDVQMHLSRNGD